MKKIISLFLLIAVQLSYSDDIKQAGQLICAGNAMKTSQKYVHKKILSNGMAVLVRPEHKIPRVSMQIWYNVGSKDEKTGEKGIAHLIEHMIFKGTKKLSESDINIIAHKLSGSINAFTFYDFTGYLFNMPVQHYKEVLPIMADCMQNVSFKDDHLNSEMKAVIQELKLYRDNYQRSLAMELVSDMFPDHPYHFPVIGYKQDLWNVKADDLRAFYKKHYWPNNAALVVVGDVDVEEVFKLAEQAFGKIPANPHYKKDEFFLNQDIISRCVTLYRDVQQPFVSLSYLIPGADKKIAHLIDVLGLILGAGKASRLWRKLVDELRLVSYVYCDSVMLFEHGVYFIGFEPKDMNDVEKIKSIIQNEIDEIVAKGLNDKELVRAIKQAQMGYYALLESIERQAYEIGGSYWATGDADYAFKFLDESSDTVKKELQQLLAKYFRASVRSQGMVLPIPEKDKALWQKLQKESDETDTKFLSLRERNTPVEPPVYAQKVKVKDPTTFNFPKPEKFTLSNGLQVLIYNAPTIPKIDIALEFKAKAYSEPDDLPGVYSFMTSMLTEGTKKYSAIELADELESRGMSLSIAPGYGSMSMLSSDVQKGFELLEEVLSRPRFNEDEIEKKRQQILMHLINVWDDPGIFNSQLIYERVYKNHPYSKRVMGTQDSVKKINRDNLVAIHKKFISPDGARIAIVGDLKGCDIKALLEKTLGKWQGPKVEQLEFPPLAPVNTTQEIYPIDRDQVMLCMAGLSINRFDKDFDKLLLFDQIFGGGALGSMHSRLFELRERTGLFYGISGSLTSDVTEQPGLVVVKTKVSLDRLDEAEKAIKNTIDAATNNVTDEEYQEARRAIVNSIINYFSSNAMMAQIFLAFERYHLPADYYDTRNAQLMKITKQEMVDAVKKVLSSKKMFTLKIGRLEPQKLEDACAVKKDND